MRTCLVSLYLSSYYASLSLHPSLSLSLSLSLSPLPPQLVTKVKLYRVVNSQVLATHSIALDSLHLLNERGVAILGVRYDKVTITLMKLYL